MPAKPHDGYHTYQEIMQHPQAWRAAIAEVNAQRSDLLQLWQPDGIGEVIFAGCGSTYYLARTAALVCQGMTGKPGRALPSSDMVLFPDIALAGEIPRMLIAISRSGETSETVKAAEMFQARDAGAVIGVTCYPESPLTRVVSLAVVAREAHEKSVAQTRSFTSMLVALQALCAVLSPGAGPKSLDMLADHSAALLDRCHALAQELAEDERIERFFFLGGGPFYGLACEAMLKMKEMSLSYAEAFHFLEFRHGPMAMVNDRTLVVGLVSAGAVAYEADVLAEMRQLGARVLAVTPVRLRADQVDFQIELPAGWDDLERGALYLPVLQLLAFYRALHNGLNPDQPNHLTAVVNLDMSRVQAGHAE